MCLMAPGRVTAVYGSEATVLSDGRRRIASTLVEPEVRVGDWVIVAGSLIVRRLESAAAREIQDAVELASSAPSTSDHRPMGAPR
jgi:hydrogenase assembly chaperone HypC/HupF